MRSFFIIAFTLFLQLELYSQNIDGESKIDPAFSYLIDKAKARISLVDKVTSPYKLAPVEGVLINGKIERRYQCVVYTSNAKALHDSGIIVNSVLPTFATALVTLEQVQQMATMKDVTYIDAPEISYLNNDVAVGNSGASLLHQGKLNNTSYKGKDVIVAVFDSGIDWDHPDFRSVADNTKSRILRIWDQTITAVAGEARPAGFSYGVEYTQAQINNEIDGTPANFIRQRDTNGHGTHVAGTAAGNGAALPSRKYAGIAPEADIVIIKGGNDTFSESNEIDAITYLQGIATNFGKPVVLNMSVGGQSGPHDGTAPAEVAVNNFTSSAPGRSVVVSAGNENGKNIHNRVTLAGNGTVTISFAVPVATVSNSEAEIFKYAVYANNSSSISATVTAPDGRTVTANAGQTNSGDIMSGNAFSLTIENGIYPGNNQRNVRISLIRNGANATSPSGNYILTLTNNTANTLTLDGWVYEVNPGFDNIVLSGGNNSFLVGSPGGATSAITTTSYVGKNNWYSSLSGNGFFTTDARIDSISTFASPGPRRDGVIKPDIAADGQAVVSALSSDYNAAPSDVVETGLYYKNQGTSMAAPGVAGTVALLLQANPSATAVQIKNLIISTATKDAMTELTGATPNAAWGYGKLDAFKAASVLFNCLPADRKTYQYDVSTRNNQESGATYTTERVAVRFTTDISGKLGGVFYQTSLTATALFIEVRRNNAGNPGTLLGTLNLSAELVAKYTINYADLSSLNITVASGTDYFIVIGRTSAANWSLRREAISVDGRTLLSSDGGNSWSSQSYDAKIRSVVYSNAQISGAVASANSSDTRNINTSIQFINSNCQLIAQVVPAGASPFTGVVTGKVWIEQTVPKYNAVPYVQRHYEITPVAGTSATSARVTLYFTQAEFNAFNNDPSGTVDLPANPTDNAGKANLRITKFPGSSSNATGIPETYTGTPVVTDPDDANIVWNNEANRWEISFDITGFGGFIVGTNATALPRPDTNFVSTLYPNLIRRGATVQVKYKGVAGSLLIHDVQGKLLFTRTLTNGSQPVALPLYISGVYFFTIRDDSGVAAKGKIVVQ